MITQEQCDDFVKQLFELGREARIHDVKMPTLRLDRSTFDDLEEAMREYVGGKIILKWRDWKGNFFESNPRIMGFPIEIE